MTKLKIDGDPDDDNEDFRIPEGGGTSGVKHHVKQKKRKQLFFLGR